MSIFSFRKKERAPLNEQEQRSNCSCWSDVTLFNQYQEQSATGLSAFFSCMELISTSIAQLPIQVNIYKENEKSVDENNEIAELFYQTRMSKFQLIKKLVEDIIRNGNSFLLIKRDSTGKPKSLQYVNPQKVVIKYNELKDKVEYYTSFLENVQKLVQPKDILHFYYYSGDGIKGISFTSMMSRTLKLANSTEKYASDYFTNGCKVNGILSFEGRVTDEQKNKIRNNFQQLHQQNGGIAILEGGTKYQAIETKISDNQVVDIRNSNTKDICRCFGVNPVLIGEQGTSYSSIEDASISFVTQTLSPWVKMFENEINRKLIDNKLYRVNLDEQELLRSNKSNLATYIRTLVDCGVITRNEGRNIIGLNPVEGGDELTVSYSDISQNTINKKEE